MGPIIQQFRAKKNPAAYKKSATGEHKPVGPLRPPVAETMQLAEDGVLEVRVLLHQGEIWVPYMPDEPMPYTTPEVSWRRWIFDQLHRSFTKNHHNFMETFSDLQRTAHWRRMGANCAEWVKTCEICVQFKGATMRPPTQSIYAQEAHVEVLPWEDVIIDVQGPFTKSEDGMMYILSYHCSRLRVPVLDALKSMQTGHFGRSFANQVFKTRVYPKTIRSDQGQEMKSAVIHELMVMFGDPNRIFGPAYTPRVQGLGERGHMVVLINLTIMMNTICRAFPQEWSALLPAVEFLYFTAPQGSLGFSARDMTMGFSMARRVSADLTPFIVPEGLMETSFAMRLFDNFRHLYSIFVRVTQEEKYRDQLRVNQHRWLQQLDEGDMVFRKLPKGARPPKKMLYPASEGPFFVAMQKSKQSAVLKDEDGNLRIKGANIPLTQLIVCPRRPQVSFEDDDEVRSLADMVNNQQYYGKMANK